MIEVGNAMRKIIKTFEGVYVEKIVSDESEVYNLKNQFGSSRFKVTPMEMGKYKVEYYDKSSDKILYKDIREKVLSENKTYKIEKILEFIAEVEDSDNVNVFFIVGEDYYGRKYLPQCFSKGTKYDGYSFELNKLCVGFTIKSVYGAARGMVNKNTSDKKYCIMSCKLKDFDKFIKRAEASNGDISSCSFLKFESFVSV